LCVRGVVFRLPPEQEDNHVKYGKVATSKNVSIPIDRFGAVTSPLLLFVRVGNGRLHLLFVSNVYQLLRVCFVFFTSLILFIRIVKAIGEAVVYFLLLPFRVVLSLPPSLLSSPLYLLLLFPLRVVPSLLSSSLGFFPSFSL
jgi:hypothetical protein